MELKSRLGLITVLAVGPGVLALMAVVTTNPRTIGPTGVTMWFVGLGVALTHAITLGLYWIKRRVTKQTDAARLENSWRQGLLLGGALTSILALSSLRQLQSRDAILIAIFVAVVEFYLRTRKA